MPDDVFAPVEPDEDSSVQPGVCYELGRFALRHRRMANRNARGTARDEWEHRDHDSRHRRSQALDSPLGVLRDPVWPVGRQWLREYKSDGEREERIQPADE